MSVAAAILAIAKATEAAVATAKLINDTVDLVAEARKVATSSEAAEIDAALAQLQARNDVEIPAAIAALRGERR